MEASANVRGKERKKGRKKLKQMKNRRKNSRDKTQLAMKQDTQK